MLTIYGNRPPSYDPKAGEEHKNNQVAPAIELEQLGAQGLSERRRRPDRRIDAATGYLPERRKRSRRTPQLLSAKNRQPESLTPTKGLHIDTKV